jgi:energy-coupling factor transporter ATP-binding protein EcfA2
VGEVETSSLPVRPFPGLRSFETAESLIFFGRETHTEALLQRLSEGRFLAIVGASGGGKSSLVKAGLLPSLYRGYLTGSTTRWRIAVMRPGSAPLEALAASLVEQAGLGTGETCLPLLRSTTLGLVQVAEAGGLQPGESLLVVADQFEELFRFRDGQGAQEERQHFVSLLLNAVERSTPRVYVALTMRYEYLADCSQFPGLPEALNASQYLIPRLTRDQRQAAIEGPLRLVGIRIAPRLVQALLNEAGDDPYQLPVLQHALLRTFLCWQSTGADGPLDLTHYERAGRLERALDTHAGEIYEHLSGAVVPQPDRHG